MESSAGFATAFEDEGRDGEIDAVRKADLLELLWGTGVDNEGNIRRGREQLCKGLRGGVGSI